jgi:4-amino-4-deoxy-L-arabinose transferase-like glycosyltransferase
MIKSNLPKKIIGNILLVDLHNWLWKILIGFLVFTTLWLRVANLGYADYNGDEIKAFCRIDSAENLPNFLLGQRKGPVQFLFNCLYKVIDSDLANHFALRLPTTLASSLCVIAIYLLARQYFDTLVSVSAAFLFATNGIFVALGRIYQYQSITILCTLVGVLCFTKAVQDHKWRIKGIYIGLIAVSISLLAHFDGAYALPPMAYLFFLWWQKYKDHQDFTNLVKHFLIAAVIFIIPLLLFYVPFVINLNSHQLDYWELRMTVSTSNSWELFRLYNPGPIIWVYLFLIALGILRLRLNKFLVILTLWMIPPIIVMEMVMTNPGTHFYTYLLPILIIGANGLDSLYLVFKRITNHYADPLSQILMIGLFGFLGIISHLILEPIRKINRS